MLTYLVLGDDRAKIFLKKVCTTRRKFQRMIVFTLKYFYGNVLKSVTNIIRLNEKLETFEFALTLNV